MGWMSQVCGDNEHDYIEVNKKYLTKLEEENKNLQSELKAESESIVLLTKELRIYKKALELACSADGLFWESEYNDYLQKAREKNDSKGIN